MWATLANHKDLDPVSHNAAFSLEFGSFLVENIRKRSWDPSEVVDIKIDSDFEVGQIKENLVQHRIPKEATTTKKNDATVRHSKYDRTRACEEDLSESAPILKGSDRH